MEKTESKPASVANSLLSEHDSDKSLDLVRKILFGEQVRATEKKQASLERHIQNSVDALNRETQQELGLLRKELLALEQKTLDWQQDILRQIAQTGQQLQQNKVDRQVMADLLEGMAGQLKGDDMPERKLAK